MVLNKLKNNSLFSFIFGGIIFGSIGIYGANVYQSNTIEYSPTDTSWEVNNVNEAINSLYSMKTELDNIKSIGDATAAQILSGKQAVVKGSAVTGSMTNRGAINKTITPTSSQQSYTIPAGYHNGSGKVVVSAANVGTNLNYITETTKVTYNSSSVSTSITATKEIKKGIIVVGVSTYTSIEASPTHNGFTCTSTGGKVTLLRQTTGNIYYGIYGVATYLLEDIPSGTTITFGATQSKSISYNYIYGQLYSLD